MMKWWRIALPPALILLSSLACTRSPGPPAERSAILAVIDGETLDLTVPRDAARVVRVLRERLADPYTDTAAQPQALVKTLAAADSLVQGDLFCIEPFAPVRLSKDIDWGVDPYGNRSWCWSLHAFSWLQDLLAAHTATGHTHYLDRALAIVTDWETDNLVPEPPSAMAWHDQVTGLRLEVLLDLIFTLVPLETYPSAATARLLRLAVLHGDKLMDPEFYNAHTNHGFDQVLALARLGLALPELVDAQGFRETGLARLQSECDFAFDDHGVHRENSPAYHFHMIKLAFRMRDLLEAYGLESPGLDDLLAQALEVAIHLVLPNGEMPLIGDTHVSASKRVPVPTWVPRRQEILYVLRSGDRGVAPDKTDLILPESGYVATREGWGGVEDFDRPVALIMKLAANSHYHFHDDILSFCLYGRGERWLVDCGIYKYDHQDPYRLHVTSRLAHNVVTVDDGAHTADPGPIPSAWRDGRATGVRTWVEATYELGDAASHTRSLLYLKPELVLVRDVLVARDGANHDFKQIFHVDRHKDVVETADGFVLHSRSDSSLSLTISCVTDGVETYRVRGQTEPHLQGWASYCRHEIEPIDVVGFRQQGDAVEFRTIISFGPALPRSVDLADWNFGDLSRP